ncbi:hypothetical protein J6590_009167 [Homalodisca vitripennis]|nr:hypothetical protein J6590_009167 [Homalodisca vitripennis]
MLWAKTFSKRGALRGEAPLQTNSERTRDVYVINSLIGVSGGAIVDHPCRAQCRPIFRYTPPPFSTGEAQTTHYEPISSPTREGNATPTPTPTLDTSYFSSLQFQTR